MWPTFKVKGGSMNVMNNSKVCKGNNGNSMRLRTCFLNT